MRRSAFECNEDTAANKGCLDDKYAAAWRCQESESSRKGRPVETEKRRTARQMLQGVAKDFCFAYRIVFHKYVKRRTMENTAGNTSSNLATANVHVLFRRLFAGLLDLVFVTFASALVGATIGAFAGADPGESATVDAVVNTKAILAAIVLTFVIFGRMQSRTGQTLRKKLFKIEVVREEDGKHPSLGRALLRTLLLLVDGMFFGLVALLAVLMSDKNRRLGDMAARTLVVRGRTPVNRGKDSPFGGYAAPRSCVSYSRY